MKETARKYRIEFSRKGNNSAQTFLIAKNQEAAKQRFYAWFDRSKYKIERIVDIGADEPDKFV